MPQRVFNFPVPEAYLLTDWKAVRFNPWLLCMGLWDACHPILQGPMVKGVADWVPLFLPKVPDLIF